MTTNINRLTSTIKDLYVDLDKWNILADSNSNEKFAIGDDLFIRRC